MLRRQSRAALLAISVALVGCHENAPTIPMADQQQQNRASADARLQSGTWRLASWKPDDALESMLSSLLAQQYGTMTIRFANGRVLADSPSVHINRAYSVVDASGPQFVVVTTDDAGVELRTSAQFSEDGNNVYFRGEIEPWRGNGQLTRAGR